ncbi:hypothetical protein [Spirosoma aerolatum]|uniref:hypothetical protein n=1 Tax=Spirosoma aerolatum TaxID=1211326 RepID=UPI0009AE4691|nr:hypothetical protein [Spirosoma aerolatum]
MTLYSVNCYIKYYIQKVYYNDIHFVWCSDQYDSRKEPAHSPSSLVPPTSNPAEIYNDLKEAVRRGDRHNYKILEQRTNLKNYAAKSASNGTITDDQRDEIIYLADSDLNDIWRPLVYVIPKAAVLSRIELVPLAQRAGMGPEYRIKDLKGTEFTIIEP